MAPEPLTKSLQALADAAKVQREGAAQNARTQSAPQQPTQAAPVIIDQRGLPTQ